MFIALNATRFPWFGGDEYVYRWPGVDEEDRVKRREREDLGNDLLASPVSLLSLSQLLATCK